MPMKSLSFLLTALTAMLLPGAASAEDIAIHAGRLIDGVARIPRSNVTVLIHDDRIIAIMPGFTRPTGARVIDLSRKTVLPGLIDGHVHLLFDLERFPGLLPTPRAAATIIWSAASLMPGPRCSPASPRSAILAARPRRSSP